MTSLSGQRRQRTLVSGCGAFLVVFTLAFFVWDELLIVGRMSLSDFGFLTRSDEYVSGSRRNKIGTTHVRPSSMTDEHYNLLHQTYCPDGIPNLQMAEELFPLSRELLLTESMYNLTTQPTKPPAKDMPEVFFAGDFDGGTAYINKLNPKANVYYARIWKAGNNQIRFWFQRYVQQPQGVLAGEEPPVDDMKIKGVLKMMEREGRDPADLCIITAVRDPISHFLSGYNEAEFRLITLRKAGKAKRGAREFAPYYSMPRETPLKRKARFVQFLMDLLNQHPDFSEKYEYKHIYEMSRILVPLWSEGYKLKGYLPSVANVTNEWPGFVKQTCPELPNAEVFRTPMKLMGQHPSSRDMFGVYAAAKAVWADQGVAAEVLCLLRAVDYACWEDLPDGIPELCQSVYLEKLL